MAKRKHLRPLSKKAARNRTCHLAIEEIKAGNCSLTDMSFAINEACRRAPKKLQMLATKTINRRCGGRLQGLGHRHKLPTKAPEAFADTIRPGCSVTISTPQGQTRTGRAVMRGPAGWVLNLGGRHGTPGIATPSNTLRVRCKAR